MKPDDARAAIAFLQRTIVYGNEVPAFNRVMVALIAEANVAESTAKEIKPFRSPNFDLDEK